MPTRNLGETGYKVGIFSLGGQSAIEQPNNFDVAVPLIERALDLGVNLIDTAPRYGLPERWSEQYIGRVMQHRRNDVFLATKSRERSRDSALRDIEQSLKLMKTDHLDLWLLHNIGIPEEVSAVFAKGGAMEAFTQMHDQKVVRYLGVAAHYQPEPIMATRPGTLNMRDAMNYVLSLPVSTVIIGCDNIAQLEENVRIAREFTPLSQAQMAAITKQAAPIANQALFFHSETRPREIPPTYDE